MLSSLILAGCTSEIRGWAGPAVTDGITYLVTPDQKLLALDLEARSRGEPFPTSNEWRFPQDDQKLGIAYATPVLYEDTLYVASYQVKPGQGRLYALNPEARSRREPFPASGEWQFQDTPQGVVGNIVGEPTVFGDIVYVGSADSYVYALSASTGELKWRFKTDDKVWAGVVVDGDRTVFAASLDHKVYALDSQTGAPKWEFETQGAIASAPLYAEGVLYFGSADGKLYAVNTDTGQLLWEFDAGSWIWGSPFLGKGTLYVGSLSGEVFALDAFSGVPRWPVPGKAGGSVNATPLLVADTLAVAAQDGQVYGFDPATGLQKWGYLTDPEGAIFAPIASDNETETLYVMPFNDRLVTLDGKTGIPKLSLPFERLR